jgi:hypothetical protein
MSTIETKHRQPAHLSSNGNGNGNGSAHAVAPHNNHNHAPAKPRATAKPKNSLIQLNNYERFFAALVLGSWLFLFAGGILVDTKPYRCVISPSGVEVLADEGTPGRQTAEAAAEAGCTNDQKQGAGLWVPSWPQSWNKFYVLGLSWLAVILFFLPLNLALVCATAGTLGAFGGKANLQDDATPHNSRDESNPYVSGLLRGFFVYLFMISGLLLFDDKPFSNPGPGQYIRFAGFLSLFSFVVNYQPYLFTTLIEGAFQRISARRGGAATTDDNVKRKEQVFEYTTETKKQFKRADVTTETNSEESEPEPTPRNGSPKAGQNGGGEAKAKLTTDR